VETDQALFSRYPPNTVAVRTDGVYFAVPGGPGNLRALDGKDNPEFYDKNGHLLGAVEVSGVNDAPQTCSLFAISNLSRVRGAAYLVVWYLTRYTAAPAFEVHSVNPQTLGRLLKRVGMTWAALRKDMVGSTEEVCRAARQKCQKHHWRLREQLD